MKTGIFTAEAQSLFHRMNELFEKGLLSDEMYHANHQALIDEWNDIGTDQKVLTVQQFLSQAQKKTTPED